MTNRLEELKKEAREKFLKECGWDFAEISVKMDARITQSLKEITSHIYTQAIQDAIGALPEKSFWPAEIITSMGNVDRMKGRDTYRSEATTNLQALLPQQ